MKQKQKQNAGKKSPLPLIALAVGLAAAAVLLLPKLFGSNDDTAVSSFSEAENGDLVIRSEDIGAQASFFAYDAGGTTVEIFAVRASDGTVRLALNTCQVCNGSPYSYFVQEGDDFVCQNCRNRFASTQVGLVSGGCNPVPITDSVCTKQDGIITVPASFLEDSASLFRNWKNF